MYLLIDVRVQAERYRTMDRSLLHDHPVLGCQIMAFEVKVNHQSNDAPGIVGHHFLDLPFEFTQVPAVLVGFDPHYREHAGEQANRNRIGRRKGFALALIVDGSVGEHGVARANMDRLGA